MPTEATLSNAQRFFIHESAGSRGKQEDAAIYLANPGSETALVVVCDGVGGSSGGGAASRIATEQATEYWKQHSQKLDRPEQELPEMMLQAHEQIREKGKAQGNSPRTTMVALYLDAQNAHWVHSGDSRLYHFRGAQLLSRTRDHSVVEILVKQGQVEEDKMGSHPDQGRLLQSLGGPDYKPPTQGTVGITPDDAFLLCTDGFWERTTPEEMADILYAPRERVEELLEHAVQRAAQRNGKKSDNLTVAVVLPQRQATAEVRPPSRQGFQGIGVLILTALALVAVLVYVLFINGAGR